MTSSHEAGHERLLAALLEGRRSPDEPDLRRLLDACADCRARYEVRRQVIGSLEDAARTEREVLAEIERMPPVPGEEQVRGWVRNAARPTRRARRWRSWLMVAAAVTILAGGWLASRGLQDGDDGSNGELVPLGPTILDDFTPSGAVRDFARFTWKMERPQAGYYVVEVRPEAGGVALPPVKSQRLRQPEWEPPEEEHTRWDRIHWTVGVYRLGGGEQAERTSAEVSSWRSSD